MKVLVKSDRVPIVLMLIGAAFVIVSSLSDHAADAEFKAFLFPVGFAILVLGFLLWGIPAYLKYLRKKARKASKRVSRPEDDDSRPRRYARPRR
jgi:hypothetical protein